MIVELIGVNTGLLFGTYQYGENLGIKVFGVPFLIGINWGVITFLTANIANRFIKNKWLVILCGSILMVALDFLSNLPRPSLTFGVGNLEQLLSEILSTGLLFLFYYK